MLLLKTDSKRSGNCQSAQVAGAGSAVNVLKASPCSLTETRPVRIHPVSPTPKKFLWSDLVPSDGRYYFQYSCFLVNKELLDSYWE